MEYVIMICGFLGAWLLFAGPVWQAVIELQEDTFDQRAFRQVTEGIAQPAPVSKGWWLLPPVYWAKQSARSRDFRDAVMAGLPADQREQGISFLNKATGWFIVAGGALLIAVKETWELCELFEWPLVVFVILVLGAAALGISNAVWRDRATKRSLARSASGSVDPASQ